MIDITTTKDPMRNTMAIISEFNQMDMIREGMSGAIFTEICRLVAERYVAENFQEIAKAIDPQAIANLSVAEAGAEISRTLKQEVAKQYIEVHKKTTEREVYQRGVFGGLSRVG